MLSKIIIKKTSDRNQYLLTESGFWVRDFNQISYPIDINHFTQKAERATLMKNEVSTLSSSIPEINDDYLGDMKKVIIVSDGWGFEEKKHILNTLPKDVGIIGINGTLAKWDVNEKGHVKRKMDFYFINNPYNNCMVYYPRHKYRPKCICSVRTYFDFLKKYKGKKYYYTPTPSKQFGNRYTKGRPLDDYRNPLCGALSIAIKLNAERIAFLCCDCAFKNKRPAAEQLTNGLWIYPQHKITNELIDGMLYWLKQKDEDLDIKVVNHSHGGDYNMAPYIELDNLTEFYSEI